MHDSTVDSSLLSTAHGRQRREERNISKIDLQSARRYGMEDSAKYGNRKYVYGGKVFIYNPRKNCEVTSFPSSDVASTRSGTQCAQPVILEHNKSYVSNDEIQKYKAHVHLARVTPEKWTSHTVFVIDMSGSMRRDDVNGARCRSDGVWLVLARDFVKKQLESGSGSINDIVSVIVMRDEADILVNCFPLHWILYNLFLEYREWKTVRPRGPGNYLPALKLAEQLLAQNPSGKCSLSLMFFSDGKPSDRGPFADRVGSIASKFGRRLTVSCIGMADDSEDFSTLQDMVTEAEHYGALASFSKPTLAINSLSNIISSLVTSLNTSKTEMTDLKTGVGRSVRVDLRRERKGAPDDLTLTSDWDAFRSSSTVQYVPYIHTWSYKRDNCVTLMDPRCIGCYSLIGDSSFKANHSIGFCCEGCKACFFCYNCSYIKTTYKSHARSECQKSFVRDRRLGHFVKQALPSWSIAIKKLVYGEGAERIVYKVRFLDENDEFVGPKMVAKESRFVESKGAYQDKLDYHKEFMRTQTIASRFAERFNEALDSLVDHFAEEHHKWLKRLPRIRFLKPMVVEVIEEKSSDKERNILIEEFLDGEYKKFNSNMGFVRGEGDSGAAVNPLDILVHEGQQLGLGAIVEGSEDEDSDDDEDVFDSCIKGPDHGRYGKVRAEDFPQAFSHFTYEKSKKQLMVVDLQGVFKVHRNSTREYVLTDPAIHKRRRSNRTNKLAGWTFGRTDRGEKGMQAFFDSHECSEACRLLGLENHRKRKS